MLRIIGISLTALAMSACTPAKISSTPSPTHLVAESLPVTQGSIPQPVRQSVVLPRPKARPKAETYSVVVNNVRVQDLLFALARDARLNVDVHPGINGSVTLNAIDQTLPQLLGRIAKQVDMRYELDGPNLAVMPDTPYLKNYKIDYVNMSRDVTGTVSTNTQIATSAVSDSSSGDSNTSRIQIENKSKNRFWESLEKNLKDLLHETDKVFPAGTTETVVEQNAEQSGGGTSLLPSANANTTSRSTANRQNQEKPGQTPETRQFTGATVVKRMTFREAASVIASPETGVITVRATSRQHEKVQEFLDRVMASARRQVLIEATIVEVELSDGYQQGIEWNRLRADGSGFEVKTPSLSSNVGNALTPFVFSYSDKSQPLNLLAAVNLLQSFGTLKVLSSPKLTVLNNQTATLKVSEEFVYFKVKSDVSAGSITSNALKAFTTTPQSVSIGFFMSLTAQISDHDTVTLSIRPSISSISDLKQDPNPDLASANIKNLVPQIRTREIESLMRIESGDIAVLGGLMEDQQNNKLGRFPGLGDVLLFGEVLNKRDNSSRKTELVIFIRPTVIHDASLQGDYSTLSGNLPDKDFFKRESRFQPFALPHSSRGVAP